MEILRNHCVSTKQALVAGEAGELPLKVLLTLRLEARRTSILPEGAASGEWVGKGQKLLDARPDLLEKP